MAIEKHFGPIYWSTDKFECLHSIFCLWELIWFFLAQDDNSIYTILFRGEVTSTTDTLKTNHLSLVNLEHLITTSYIPPSPFKAGIRFIKIHFNKHEYMLYDFPGAWA